MSFEHTFLLSDRTLKITCVAIGIVFLGIAAHVWLDGALQRNGSEPLILVPLLSGLLLLIGPIAVEPRVLRVLVLAWFVALPALFYAVNSVACYAEWFSASWCR